MAQPVKLSDDLVLGARLTSVAAKRSIAGQIEFWASLGRAVEAVLRSPELAALQRAGTATALSDALARPGTVKGTRQLARYLRDQPFPHFEPAPDLPGLLVRVEQDGTRTIGRFVRRKFVEHKPRPQARMKRRGSRRA